MHHNVIFQHSSLVKLAKYKDCSLPPDEVALPFPGTFTHVSVVVFQVNLKFMKQEICARDFLSILAFSVRPFSRSKF